MIFRKFDTYDLNRSRRGSKWYTVCTLVILYPTKGLQATQLGEPRWIHYALYSVTNDVCRGFMYHEADGKPIDERNHPQWYTWSMRTHWHTGQSPDRLGKRGTTYGEGRANNRVGSYDDQHRSQHNLAACYELTGEEVLEFIIERCAETDVAGIRPKRNYGHGAARAVGRRCGTWANFLKLTPAGSRANDVFKHLLDWGMEQIGNYYMGDNWPTKPVDIYNIGLDDRNGIFLPGVDPRQSGYCWVVWQHAIMARGYVLAWRASGDERYKRYAQRLTKLIVKCAYHKDTQGWMVFDNVWFPHENSRYNPADFIPGWVPADTGDMLPANMIGRNSWATRVGGGGVGGWTFRAGLLSYFAVHDTTDPEYARALEICESFTGKQDAYRASDSEWQAVIDSVAELFTN